MGREVDQRIKSKVEPEGYQPGSINETATPNLAISFLSTIVSAWTAAFTTW